MANRSYKSILHNENLTDAVRFVIEAKYKSVSRKLAELERKYDSQFKIVFDAIRELMKPQNPKNRPIGFGRN